MSDDIEWPDHASLPPLDPNEPGGGLLAGMGGTLDIGVPTASWDYVEITDDEFGWPHQHEHHCIIAREHGGDELCLCSCGAVRHMVVTKGEWDEP